MTTVARTLPGQVLADAVAGLCAAVTDEAVQAVKERFLALADGVAVPYAAAAERLGVSVPTVHAWTERGVLRAADGVAVRSVTAGSLARVIAIVDRVKAQHPTKRQLMRVIEDLRDQDLLRAARQASATAGPPALVTDEDLAGL